VAKSYIFESARKLKQATQRLEKSAENYNKKIMSAVESGRLRPDIAPPGFNPSAWLESLPGTLTADKAAKAAEKMAKQLDEINRKNALDLEKMPGGAEVTHYQKKQFDRLAKQYEQKTQQRIAEDARRAAEGEQIGGVSLSEPSAGVLPVPKAENVRTTKDFQRFLKTMEVQTDVLEWDAYRDDLLKNIEDKYTGNDLYRLQQFIGGMSSDDLKKLYYKGVKLTDQDYHYHRDTTVGAQIAEAKEALGRKLTQREKALSFLSGENMYDKPMINADESDYDWETEG
jgi:hypothetical protein